MSSLRKDRFFCSIPFVSQEVFYKSGFLEFYNKTERHPDVKTVIDSLRNLHDGPEKYHEVIQDIELSSKKYDVIRVYTSNIEVGSQTFYNYINQQLCKDNKQTLRHLMPLIRRATYQINRHPPPHKCVAYRGMHLTSEHRAFFKMGTIFRFPGFTSTSQSKSLAEKFGNTLFEIHISAGCLQMRDVSDISHFSYEKEYLFSPYSLFKVIDINEKIIVLRTIDNMSNIGMNNVEPILKKKFTKSSNAYAPSHLWTQHSKNYLPNVNTTLLNYSHPPVKENSTACHSNYASNFQPNTAAYSSTYLDSSYGQPNSYHQSKTAAYSSYHVNQPQYDGSISYKKKSTSNYQLQTIVSLKQSQSSSLYALNSQVSESYTWALNKSLPVLPPINPLLLPRTNTKPLKDFDRTSNEKINKTLFDDPLNTRGRKFFKKSKRNISNNAWTDVNARPKRVSIIRRIRNFFIH